MASVIGRRIVKVVPSPASSRWLTCRAASDRVAHHVHADAAAGDVGHRPRSRAPGANTSASTSSSLSAAARVGATGTRRDGASRAARRRRGRGRRRGPQDDLTALVVGREPDPAARRLAPRRGARPASRCRDRPRCAAGAAAGRPSRRAPACRARGVSPSSTSSACLPCRSAVTRTVRCRRVASVAQRHHPHAHELFSTSLDRRGCRLRSESKSPSRFSSSVRTASESLVASDISRVSRWNSV